MMDTPSTASTVSATTTTTLTSNAPSITVEEDAYIPRYIDIGINLTDPVYTGTYHGRKVHVKDRAEVITRALTAGVQKLIVTGSCMASSASAQKLHLKNPAHIYSTVGIHPCHATATPDIERLEALAGLPGVVAFGEFGLDYDRLHYASKEVQRQCFSVQLDLVERMEREQDRLWPMFLHMRNATEDFEAELWPRIDRKSLRGGGVVHSFTGSIEEMRRITDRGLYVGVNGCSLKTEEALKVVEEIPLESLMLETDGPWCEIRPTHASSVFLNEADAPVVPGLPAVKKERFKVGSMVKGRNEPATICRVAHVVARVKGVPIKTVCEAAWRNSVKLFGLGETVD